MRFPHGYGVHVVIDCMLRAKLPLRTGCSFQGVNGSNVIDRKATDCALMESDVRNRTKGIGPNEFPKAMSEQSGVLPTRLSIGNLFTDFLSTEFVQARACVRVGHPALVNVRLFATGEID